MPLIIEEMHTSLEILDEAGGRRLVRDEHAHGLEQGEAAPLGPEPPVDRQAGGRPGSAPFKE